MTKGDKRAALLVTIAAVGFIGLMLYKLSGLVMAKHEKEQETIELRKANDGAVPKLELLGSDGQIYQVITFEKEPGIICLRPSRSTQMACYNKNKVKF